MSRVVIFNSSNFATENSSRYLQKTFKRDWTNPALRAHIPETWPETRKQIGGTCGLYALYIGLVYFMVNSQSPREQIPLPVNESLDSAQKRETTLFSLARQSDLTKAGEILNIDYFALLLAQLAIPPKQAIHSDPQHFLQDLCKQLDENNTVIVSCDLAQDSLFPGVSDGFRAHWILAFGYFYLQKNLFFLTTHQGSYYVIAGADLLKSNSQDPNMLYPKCETFGSIVSTDRNRFMGCFKSHQELIAQQANEPEQQQRVTNIPRTTLKQFFCTMFPIPVSYRTTPSKSLSHVEELEVSQPSQAASPSSLISS